jgi:hypothetical protein
MAKNKIWGIKITRNYDEPIKGSFLFVNYTFEFTHGSYADPMFFTSPALRNAIEKNPHWEKNKKIGSIEFLPSGEGIMQQHTYPFVELKKEDRKLIGLGIGIGLERKVLSDFKKRFGNIILEPSFDLTGPNRARQLEFRGIKFNPEKIPSYHTKVSRMLDAINMIKRRRKRITQKLPHRK